MTRDFRPISGRAGRDHMSWPASSLVLASRSSLPSAASTTVFLMVSALASAMAVPPR
ncbi:hypothetical protein O1L60_11715 [Streptomyces diastatochromogenes]|nr:hypothetical protein [Streptomyces diastatochromogenes]